MPGNEIYPYTINNIIGVYVNKYKICGTQAAMISGYAMGTIIDDKTPQALSKLKGKCTWG